MNRFTRGWMAALLAGAAVTAQAQSELQQYVTRCQNELQFAAAEVKPMNCNNGPNFAFGHPTPVNDFVTYQRVNQNVDMIAACRWGDGDFDTANSTKFASVEMLMHNRQNGATCFFAAKDIGSDPLKPISTALVSPTNFNPFVHPNADDFWLTPSQLNSKMLLSDANPTPGFTEKLQCVRCHSQGPYIASSRIVEQLANFGLINDGHDTFVNFSAARQYHVVGSQPPNITDPGAFAFGNWNFLISQNNDPANCSGACHTLAANATIGNLTPIQQTGANILPSITTDLLQLDGSGLMPPFADDSPYHWINVDQPSDDGVEIETFTESKTKFPVLGNCGAPTVLEANATGTASVFSTAEIATLPNKLRSFNLRDGLVCLNADQPGGARCADYSVAYKCPGPNEKWTPFFDKDTLNTDDGDHEERSKSIGDATAFCGGTPVAMQAQVMSGGATIQVKAPNDRLAQFSPSGLVCRNSDQGSGQTCANYTVRYRACRSTGDANMARVKNAWVNPPTFGDRYLTTTNNVDGAEARAQANNFQFPSQDWIIEPVPGGNTVRLSDVWSGKFLTASSNADLAVVQVKNSDLSLMRQQWVMESVANSVEVRFRNVGTGRYLTVGNFTSDPNFAPIFSQSLSNQNWASQRWLIL